MDGSAPSYYQAYSPTQPLNQPQYYQEPQRPPYRDKLWAFLFILHLTGVITLGAVLFHKNFDHFQQEDSKQKIDKTVILLILLILGTGMLIALGWLSVVRSNASALIKITLGFGLVASFAVVVLALIGGSLAGLIIGGIGFVLQLIYVYMVRDRIPFASALLSLSIKPIQEFSNVITLAFIGIIFQAVWLVGWFLIAASVYVELQKHSGNHSVQPYNNYNTNYNSNTNRIQPYDQYNNQYHDSSYRTSHRRSYNNENYSVQLKSHFAQIPQNDDNDVGIQQNNEYVQDGSHNAGNVESGLVVSAKSIASPDDASIDDALQTYGQTTRRGDSSSPSNQPPPNDRRYDVNYMNSTTALAVIGLVLSFYWTSQVIKNVVACSICGVCASWYYIFPSPIPNAVWGAFKRSTTTSFGSICLGSLVLAVIRTIRLIINFLRNRSSEEHNNLAIQCFYCLLDCIMSIIDSIVEYVNQYAYVFVATFGDSYCDSAKKTFNLLKRTYLLPVINDSLIGGCLTWGTLLGGLLVGAISSFLSIVVLHSTSAWWVWGLIGFICGLAMMALVCEIIELSTITLFVCYAENPDALKLTKPSDYYSLSSTIGMRISADRNEPMTV